MAISITVEADGITKKTDKRESFVSDANGVTYYVDTKGQLVTGQKKSTVSNITLTMTALW